MKDYEMISDKGFIPYLEKNITNTLVRNRLCNLLCYYMKTASMCRSFYHISAALTILLPTIVTVVSSFSGMWSMGFINVFTAIVAGVSAVISGFTTLFKWQEGWIRYRMASELLKRESVYYIGGIGIYEDPTQRDSRFLQEMERIATELTVKMNEQASMRAVPSDEAIAMMNKMNNRKDRNDTNGGYSI